MILSVFFFIKETYFQENLYSLFKEE